MLEQIINTHEFYLCMLFEQDSNRRCNMSTNKTAGDGKMDSYTIHHTPEGLMLETEDKSVLIGEKDLPLVRRGITRPLRDAAHKPIGLGNNACVMSGCLVIQWGNDKLSLPPQIWMDRNGIRRVLLSPSQVVTA